MKVFVDYSRRYDTFKKTTSYVSLTIISGVVRVGNPLNIIIHKLNLKHTN